MTAITATTIPREQIASSPTPRPDLRRMAGIAAIASAPIAIASAAVVLSGAEWNSAIFEDPTLLLGYGASASTAARLGMVLDVVGYYALLMPALLVVSRHLGRRNEGLAALARVAGITYVVVGATGAAILAATWPATLDQIEVADTTQRAALSASFDAITEAVFSGMWNLIGSSALAVFLFITGRVLWTERRAFAVMSIAVGAACAIDAAATAAGATDVGSLALQVYLYGAPVWAAWLGILILRQRLQAEQS